MGRKTLFTQAVPLLGISGNLPKSQKDRRIVEVSWRYLQAELAPKHQLAFLNFLHLRSSRCVQPSLAGYVITALPTPCKHWLFSGRQRETLGYRPGGPSLSVTCGGGSGPSSPLGILTHLLVLSQKWTLWVRLLR